VVVLSAILFLLAMRPFWGGFRSESGVVVNTTEIKLSRGGPHCEVSVAFLEGVGQRSASVEAQSACRSMPGRNEPATLLIDADGRVVRIVGYDRYLTEGAEAVLFGGFTASTVALGALWWITRRYRLVKRLTRKRPWHEVQGLVEGAWISDGPESFLMLVTDSTGKGRRLLVRCNARRPDGFEPEEGWVALIWLVADGRGNAVLRAPAGPDWVLAKVSIPNDFELRALGI